MIITLAELKTFLNITDTSKDDLLNQAINNADGFVEGYLWYSLLLNEWLQAIFLGILDQFELRETNINSVSKIEYWEDEFDETLTEYTGKKRVYEQQGLVKTQECVWPFTQITYSFGYDDTTAPQDLKTAYLEIASTYYKSSWETSAGDVRSETVDGDSISFSDTRWKISDKSMTILNKYKIYAFSS